VRAFIERTAVPFVLSMENPACVLDADVFYYGGLPELLRTLDGREGARVILTPHPKELHALLTACGIGSRTLAEVVENRLEAAQEFGLRFPNLVLVAKGANTFIVHGGSAFIFDGGSAALAKAGSGDVLAGLCAGLLAQGYDAELTARTAVFAHGAAASRMQPNYALTPLALCGALRNFDGERPF
ncbi:MAG: NAD(P)H-hydrate dehydratase, partial [Treponemataceae bacterium]|nr:NAD(P)H-hydrate dehydratase [Treponemataceae bacterium]